MADKQRPFRQDHEMMRQGAMRPTSRPAAGDRVAASGGLDLPGSDPRQRSSDVARDRAAADAQPPPTALSVDKLGGPAGTDITGTRNADAMARVSDRRDDDVRPGVAVEGHVAHARALREPFPGEREASTLIGTQPGAVGGVGFGASQPPVDIEATMDEQTVREHAIEGGGADSQRKRQQEKGGRR